MRNKFIPTIIIFFSIIILNLLQPVHVISESEYLVLEDFQKYGSTPFSDWKFKKPYVKAASIYKIVNEDGKKFLRASTIKTDTMVQLGKQINDGSNSGQNKLKWDIYRYPNISWEWRVKTIPAGANEKQDKTNDSAASIYVVFQKGKIPFADFQSQPANWIKYVWSSTQPVGTVITKKYIKFGISLYEGKYVVVASGNKNLGKWITFKRNVLADYRQYFGTNPPSNPSVLGILTDSNSTDSNAEADYDNIRAFSN